MRLLYCYRKLHPALYRLESEEKVGRFWYVRSKEEKLLEVYGGSRQGGFPLRKLNGKLTS